MQWRDTEGRRGGRKELEGSKDVGCLCVVTPPSNQLLMVSVVQPLSKYILLNK